MKITKKILAILCAGILCLSMVSCGAAQPAAEPETQPSEDTHMLQQTADWLLGIITEPGYGSVGGEWTVLGLARSGLEIPQGWFEDYYQSLCAHTADQGGVLDSRKYTEYSRVILAVTAIGKDPSDVAGFNLLQPLADFDQTVFQGINGPVFALLALDSGNYEIPENENFNTQATRDLYVDYILNAQLPDGGWSLMGSEAEIDVTAMALQALAKYQDRKDVTDAVEKGLAVLSEQQNEQGSYPYNSGEQVSSESVSQVIVALAELGIALDDSRFVKNGNTLLDALMQFRQEDGGFAHLIEGTSDLLATEQAFYALVAANRVAQGESSLYRMK